MLLTKLQAPPAAGLVNDIGRLLVLTPDGGTQAEVT